MKFKDSDLVLTRNPPFEELVHSLTKLELIRKILDFKWSLCHSRCSQHISPFLPIKLREEILKQGISYQLCRYRRRGVLKNPDLLEPMKDPEDLVLYLKLLKGSATCNFTGPNILSSFFLILINKSTFEN